jgi:Ca-activated chloride channel homolog
VISPSILLRCRTHRTYCLYLCAVLLTCTSAEVQASSSPGTEPVPAISVSSDLVLLPVHVTDPDGNFVAGLNKENFKVYEDREPQTLTVFQREDSAVSVGLIVDRSASMESKLPKVVAAVRSFAKSGNPDDEAFVIDFNDRVNVEPLGSEPFTNISDKLADAVGALSASGRTALYDALIEGITHVQGGHWGRKALFVISDGGDNASSYKLSDVVKLARQSDVVIYAVILTRGRSKDENPKALMQLCRETGGAALLPQSQESISNLSLEIARDLRQQYTLGFVPDRKNISPSFRKLEVHVIAPQLGRVNIRTRRGYFSQVREALSFPHEGTLGYIAK